MTDNIQKLYEIAGIKEKRGVELTVDPTSEEPKFNEHYVCYGYPPFTAEKQLELIKFVSNFKVYEMVKYKNRKWFMCASIGCDDYYESRSESFDQALANLIINLWQDLINDQKQEIKKILQ